MSAKYTSYILTDFYELSIKVKNLWLQDEIKMATNTKDSVYSLHFFM